MDQYLTDKFLQELFKLCFVKKSILDIVSVNLKYEYIPNELMSYKKILKSLVNHYKKLGTSPSIGYVSNEIRGDDNVQRILSEIQECELVNSDETLSALETFIRHVKFEILHTRVAETFNNGNQNDAIKTLAEESQEINDFSILKNTNAFTNVMEGFWDDLEQINNDENTVFHEKVPFGIDPLDDITYGGLDKGDTALWIMPSGVGKSTALRYTGMWAAKLGYGVLHVQLEGSKREAKKKYNQIWTGLKYNEISTGKISEEKLEKIKKSYNKFKIRNRDVQLYSFEQFEEASMKDIRDLILKYFKQFGKIPDLLIIDYLELVNPGDGFRYNPTDPAAIKAKLTGNARRMKNLCLEFPELRVLTATQTSSAPWTKSDETKVITRHDTKGDKNLVDAFSYVFTGNQTDTEYKNRIMRIYIDKLRNYKAKQIVKIATEYDTGMLYDRRRSIAINKAA